MTGDISQLIAQRRAEFSKGQAAIAKAVIEHAESIAYKTASELSQLVGVSESTVVRFAKFLGYEGYTEFQKAVQKLVFQRLTPNQRIDITKARLGGSDIINQVAKSDTDKINRTMSSLDRGHFHSACEAILRAKRIFIIGVRSAEPLALILKYNLSLIFDNVSLISPYSTAEILEQLFSVSEGDLIIAFSFPRYSTKVLSAVDFAKKSGAEVIGFTDSITSPLAQYADHLLIAQADISSYMDSLIAPISIINAIIVEITNHREALIRQRFDRLEKIWDDYKVYTKK